MARKSRAAPPTIAQMVKLEATMKVKQEAYYKASRIFNKYRESVKALGNGYTEEVNGVLHVIAVTPEHYSRQETTMTIIVCNK